MLKFSEHVLREAISIHQRDGFPLYENLFRPHSEMDYKLFQYAKSLYQEGILTPFDEYEKQLLESDIGEFGVYEGVEVALDYPLFISEEIELNKPKRGGNKKFYVYVKNDKGNIVKVEFGDTSGLSVKIDDPEARKSFAARHDCENKTDKTKPGYWSCNLPRFGKSLGLKTQGNFFW